MKLSELIDELVEFKEYGDCEVVVEDGTVSLMQDPVVRIVCDESVSKYGIFNNKESREEVMGKTVKGKVKVKAKLADAKKKIARKVKGVSCVIMVAALFAGCQQTPQASRATSAEYGDIEPTVKVVIEEKAHGNSVSIPLHITLGDGALASADSSGSTESQTLTPTQDIKPNLDVRYNDQAKVASGALETLLGNGAGAIANWLAAPGKNRIVVTDQNGVIKTAECVDGKCVECEDGNCTPK